MLTVFMRNLDSTKFLLRHELARCAGESVRRLRG